MSASDEASGGLEQAAHDLNNLLGVILNYVTLLERSAPDAMALDDLAQIRDAAERAAQVVVEVRALADQNGRVGRG